MKLAQLRRFNAFAVWTFIVIVQLHALFSLERIITTGAPDFSVFYEAARAAARGQSLYINAPFFTAFGYPPVTTLVLFALLIFPLWLSQAIWIVSSYTLLFVIVWLCLRMLGQKPKLMQVLLIGSLFFLSFPVKFTLGMGQSNLIALFLLLWISWLTEAARHTTGSVLYAVLLVLKPHLGISVLFFLLRRRWRFLLMSTVIFVIFVVSSLVVLGTWQYVDYLTHLAPGLIEYKGRGIYYNQGIGALFARIIGPPLDQILTVIGLIAIMAVTGLIVLLRQKDTLYSISVLLVSLVLVEPLAWQHHLVFVFPAILWLWYQTNGRMRALTIAGFLLVSINIKQPDYFGTDILSQLTLSHGSAGLALIYVLLIKQGLLRK